MSTHSERESDTKLAQCYQDGDKTAGDSLFRRYWVLIHNFFKNQTGNNTDAEDLCQETFYAAFKALKRAPAPTDFRAWLYTIAKNAGRKWFKEQQKQGIRLSLDALPADKPGHIPLIEQLFAPITEQPEQGVIDTELGDIRRRFEGTLARKELAIFRLRCSSNMTFKKIGHDLGIETGTVKVQYHRTVKTFKVWLKKHYPDTYDFLIGEG